MIRPQSAVWALVLLVILVTLASFRPLLPIDETRYLGVAWEMWLSGDVFHLTRNFDLYTHKPPLLFWLINLVWQFTGVSEFAARLVAPAFGVASALAMAGLARRLWPEDSGVGARSILVLASFTVFLIYASLTLFDTMLTFATILGVGILWRIGQGERGRRLWIAFGLVLALGVYAKGPVIFVHLMPALLTMPLWAPEPPRLSEAGKGFGMALGAGLILVAVWLVPALIGGTAAYREELLWTQSAARVAGGLAHDRPVWFLVALLPILLFPWAWSWRLWPATVRVVRGDAGGRMLAIWAGSGLVLFSLISGKQIHYLIPEFPAVALLMARALGGIERSGRGGSAAAVFPVILGLAALALAVGLIPATGDLAPLKPGWAVALFGLVGIALGVFGWRLSFTPAHAVFGIGLAAALHVLIVTTGLYAAYDHREISAKLAEAEKGGLAVAEMIYNAEFNFGARLTTPVAVLSGPEALRSWGAAHPEGLLFGPVDRVPVTAEPEDEAFYNGIRYGFWSSATVTSNIRD
ncbi:glycosyltransferase family 39 protein [Defluviimonas sp. WL0024]|uniref:Glycosyltransferase family 39 protein n=1 Tax=Albidovulum salinarum TaxID=2984153 RepID=A0ABT2WYR5_9RHOB|nr:glycosyltransferase family 39 protein [Defluviimonas sp. WL0024]MCU9846813.1 glycosyltransferase family 39 protein [Defluviimonas sp. WL0024]